MISFRFKSEKTFDTLRFMGEQISSGELRKQIEEKRIRKREVEVGKKWESYELLLLEEHTNKSMISGLTRIHQRQRDDSYEFPDHRGEGPSKCRRLSIELQVQEG
jgi:DWNN domain